MSAKQVTIVVRYPIAFLPAKWEAKLARALSHQFRTGAHRKFYLVDKGRLLINAGLVSRVRAHFAQQLIPVCIDNQPPFQPEDLPDLFAGASTGPEWIAGLREHPCGLILIDRSRNAPSVLARCVNSLPGANVVVVAPSKQEAERLARHAERSTLRAIQLEADFRVRQRVLFTHPFIYQMCQGEVGMWNVANFTEPRAAISGASLQHLKRGSRMRRYCLVTQSQSFRPYERLCLEAVCGTPILRTGAPHKSRARVCVLFVQAPTTCPQRPALTPWAAKRHWCWYNSSRNTYLAELAQALVRGNQGELRRLLGHQVVSKCRTLLATAQRSTTILVENEEHLAALTRLLPDWLIRTATNDPEIPADLGFGGYIATMLAAARNGLGSRVVIRADGGEGWPQEIDCPSFCRDTPNRRGLLLDLTDDGHPWLRQAVAARRDAYASYRWECLEGSPFFDLTERR